MTRLFAGRPAALVLHLSLALILAGALVTSFSARKGMLHVREGESVETFETNDGKILELPFSVELEGFEVLYHSGTDAASDYSSRLRFTRNGSVLREGEVRMNRILSCKGYRFYQTDYDSDEAGVTFTVSTIQSASLSFTPAMLCCFSDFWRFSSLTRGSRSSSGMC